REQGPPDSPSFTGWHSRNVNVVLVHRTRWSSDRARVCSFRHRGIGCGCVWPRQPPDVFVSEYHHMRLALVTVAAGTLLGLTAAASADAIVTLPFSLNTTAGNSASVTSAAVLDA